MRPVLWLLLLLAPATALGDGATVKQGPGGVFPLQNQDVQMVEETIDVEVQRDHLLADDNLATVTVTYLFRNHADRAVSIDMGFPVAWDEAEFYIQGRNCLNRSTHNAVRDFTVTLDGAPVQAQLRPGRKGLRTGCLRDDAAERAREREAAAREKGPWYNEFYVWPVSFPPKGARTIVNRYVYDARTSSRGGEWNQFEYVLKTGALWRGRIDQVTIHVRFHDRARIGTEVSLIGFAEIQGFEADPFDFSIEQEDARHPSARDRAVISPPGARARRSPDGKTELLWHLKRVKPEENISFGYRTAGAARQAIREQLDRVDPRTAPPRVVQRARETLDALYGRTFEDPAVQRRFAVKSWYIADPAWQRNAAKDPLAQKLAAPR